MPHKEELKVQEKIDLIRRCQAGELGKTEASRKSAKNIRYGIPIASEGGSRCIMHMEISAPENIWEAEAI